MSPLKMIALVIYAVLAYFAVSGPGTPAGNWSLGILGFLVVLHLGEAVIFFRTCQRAGGSLSLHLLNVLLFGVIHLREIRASSGPS